MSCASSESRSMGTNLLALAGTLPCRKLRTVPGHSAIFQPAASRLGLGRQPIVDEFERLHGHRGRARMELRPDPAHRICFGEIPAPLLIAGTVQQCNCSVLALDLSLLDVLDPTPERLAIHESVLQHEVSRVAHRTGQPVDVFVYPAFAVVLRLHFYLQPADLGEPPYLEAINLDAEVEG